MLRFGGTLCGPGPGRHPCTLAANDLIDPVHYRNDAPSIALDSDERPHVLFATAEGGFHGHYASVAAGWSSTETPFAMASGWNGFAGSDALVLAYEPTSGVGLFRSGQDGFSLFQQLPIQAIVGRQSVAGDGTGCLDAVVKVYTTPPGGPETWEHRHYHLDRGGTWTFKGSLGPTNWAMNAAILRTLSGDLQVFTGWSQSPANVRWMIPGDSPETITTEYVDELVAAVVPLGQANIPTALYNAWTPGGEPEIRVERRMGARLWSRLVLERAAKSSTCPATPKAGDTCAVDVVSFLPLAVVTSAGGDVRFIYGKDRMSGTLVATCRPDARGSEYCTFGGATTVTGELAVATLDGSFQYFSGVRVKNGTAEVDSLGRIHVAVHAPAPDYSEVRYLRLDP